MLPLQAEYLFILLVYFSVGATIFSSTLKRLARKELFWVSTFAFVVLGTIVDLLAIRWHWWHWNPDRICGLRLLNIPIEEYIGFLVGHLLTIGAWETINDDLA